jgi:hypothetical protein
MPGYLVNGVTEPPLEIPGTGGRTVVFKSAASYGDDLQCEIARAQQGAPDGMPLTEAEQLRYGQARIRAYVLARTVVMIVSWDLTDDDGKPLPVTPVTLESLIPEAGNFLATEARLRFDGRPQEREDPFEKPSSELSEAATPKTPR